MQGPDGANDYVRKILRPGEGLLLELEQYAAAHHVPIIKPETASLLIVLGRLVKPGRILEIGTAIGYSSILLSGILAAGGRIDTIERNEEMVIKAHENIKRAGLADTIAVIAGDAAEVLRCLDKKYDMIFMDAAKGQYPEFLPECLRMLKDGGLLVCDNVLYKGMVAGDEPVVRRKKTIVNRMRSFLDSICSDPMLDTSILPVGDGVALSYKRRETEMDK
ncbi:MAG: O-methyltransferase [Clostridiaceae bacterium]|jgi:predicted O-methyltransferase YrrM|nr:O-methyltransferase [Clostridiaceae bacterium]